MTPYTSVQLMLMGMLAPLLTATLWALGQALCPGAVASAYM